MSKRTGGSRYQDLELQIAGSTTFGRYNKISVSQTFNMLLSDNWLVPFAGYQMVLQIDPTGTGRAIYTSTSHNVMIAIIDSTVYIISSMLNPIAAIGNLATVVGDCWITENNNGQVVISDNVYLYCYTYSTNALVPISQANALIGKPGFLTFQNGRIICPDQNTNLWYLSALNDALTWSNAAQFVGALQTKPDKVQATLRFPGRGNLLLVFGTTVTEQWQDVGAQLFPYQRSQSTNIDYGCINPASIDENENLICWVGGNEKSGPSIMYTSGEDIKRISTDGIDYKLASLTDPANVYGYLFRQDGHLIYVATWPTDGISYAYDFNTQKFFSLCSETFGPYIAKDVVFFNGQYYFVSIIDGNIYQMGSNLYTYDYGNGDINEIPRIRITPPIQLPDQSRFIAGYSGFTIEQGQFDFDYRDTRSMLATADRNPITTEGGAPYLVPTTNNQYSLNGSQSYLGNGYNFRTNVPRIDLSLSKDGGVNFGSNVSINMRPQGVRQNRLMWWRLGAANDLVHQFRFYALSRFVCRDGITGVRN